MHSNKLEVAYWLTFSLGIIFIALAITGLKYSFAAGNTTMRVILSISHISTFYNLFLLNVQQPALLMSFAKGFMDTVMKWNFVWDLFKAWGWYDDSQTFLTASESVFYLQEQVGVNPNFITLGYTSTTFTTNMGMVFYFYIGMLCLMVMSCACNFKGSHQIVNKNLLTYGEFVGVFAF